MIFTYGQITIKDVGQLLVSMCVMRDLDIMVTVLLLKDWITKRRLS